jgi:hypothetical protein
MPGPETLFPEEVAAALVKSNPDLGLVMDQLVEELRAEDGDEVDLFDPELHSRLRAFNIAEEPERWGRPVSQVWDALNAYPGDAHLVRGDSSDHTR